MADAALKSKIQYRPKYTALSILLQFQIQHFHEQQRKQFWKLSRHHILTSTNLGNGVVASWNPFTIFLQNG